jgi:TolA-binding protein
MNKILVTFLLMLVTCAALASANQDSRDMALVLKKKADMNMRPSVILDAHGQDSFRGIGQQALYEELLTAYDRNDELSFVARYQGFMGRFSNGPLADDATYLMGLFYYGQKNYGSALKSYNQVIRKYPSGNKVAAALFAKGILLKKMSLTEQAQNSFKAVTKRFPGSPESVRAQSELKILRR